MMRKAMWWSIVVAAGVSGSACKKKGGDPAPAAKAGSGSATATGSGSAGSAASAGSAGSGSAQAAGSGSAAATAGSGDALTKAFLTCWDHFNKADWPAFGACYTPTATSTWLDSAEGRPTLTGPDAVIESAKTFKAGFPDARGDVQVLIHSGTQIAAMVLVTASNTGTMKTPMGDAPPTGKAIGQVLAQLVTLDDKGAIIKEEWLQDQATFMAQIGMGGGMPSRPAQTKGLDGAPIILSASGSNVETANLASATASTELFNKHDLAGLMATMTDDAVESDQAQAADRVGKAAIEAGTKSFMGAFPDVKLATLGQLAAGDYVATHSEMTGTNTGDDGPMKATGKAVKGHLVEFMKMSGGKVTHLWRFYNMASMAQQLGMGGPPPAGATPDGAKADDVKAAGDKQAGGDEKAAGDKQADGDN